MKNLKALLIITLLMVVSCTPKEAEQKFQETEEEDCGCDDVDTTASEN